MAANPSRLQVRLAKGVSNFFFYSNLGGLLYSALTFQYENEFKKKVFYQTAIVQGLFLVSNEASNLLKIKNAFYLYNTQTLQEAACFLACAPTYALWIYSDLQKRSSLNKSALPAPSANAAEENEEQDIEAILETIEKTKKSRVDEND